METTKSDSIIRLLAPALISAIFGIVAAWGTSQYISGQREQRILTLEYQIKELQLRQEQMVTRQEMKLFTDNALESLNQIRLDIREIRNQDHR